MRFVRSPGFRNIYRKSSGIIISIGFCGAVVASDCINICLSFDGIAVCVGYGIGIPDICQPFPSGGRSFAENTVIISSYTRQLGSRKRSQIFCQHQGKRGSALLWRVLYMWSVLCCHSFRRFCICCYNL